MPTMPERMAVVETKVATIETTTGETHDDVKQLLAWRDEERGARRARDGSVRLIGLALAAITIFVNVALRFV